MTCLSHSAEMSGPTVKIKRQRLEFTANGRSDHRDVAKISNRWDYADGRQVRWVTLKRKS